MGWGAAEPAAKPAARRAEKQSWHGQEQQRQGQSSQGQQNTLKIGRLMMKTDKAVRNSRRLRGFFKDGARMIRNNPVFRGEDERGRRPPPGRPTIPDRKCRELGGRFRRPLPAKTASLSTLCLLQFGDDATRSSTSPPTGRPALRRWSSTPAACVTRVSELSARFQLVKTKKLGVGISMPTGRRTGMNWSSCPPGVNVWQLNASNTIGSKVFIYAYPGGELGAYLRIRARNSPKGAFYYDADGHKIDCSGQHIVDASTGNPILDATNPQGPGQYLPPSGRPA